MRGFSDEDAQFIMLAVDEACTNIIKHSYKGRYDGEISILCRERGDGIEFVLTDSGERPDVSEWPIRSLEDVRPGGLGLHLIRAVMDKVLYRQGERGNELVLAKYLHPRGTASEIQQ